MLKVLLSSSLLLVFIYSLQSQSVPTQGKERIEYALRKNKLKENSIVNEIEFRSVGPSVFSGRVVDLAVDPSDPSHFFAAYASGGLWWTTNNGTTFEPLFDNEIVMTLGDIAVNWQDSIIWLGTGEVNSSRSSYAGIGMYKSSDWGKTWSHIGLEESHHIGRIQLHPSNKDIAWVAVLGHLYSPNKERGIYKTTDGGLSWKQVLFVDENSGAIDIVIDELNPDILYSATWHRERRAWNFIESGAGSGIHKSTDGGETWKKISTTNSGFPIGEGVGRIGLAIHSDNEKTTLYALLDNYNRRPKKDKESEDKLTKDKLKTLNKDQFRALPKEQIQDYLKKNSFPKKYTYEKVMDMIKKEEIQVDDLITYMEDANSLLFDTPVIGAEVYRSDDSGLSWYKTHSDYLDLVYNSYGYYFGQIRISPHDVNKIYFAGVPVLRSEDGGKTFENINGKNVHVDHHAIWCNPERDEHIILGNDGGVNISYDDGDSWVKCNYPPVGQFYAISYDMAKPYNIYGGLQDNGVWVGSSKYKKSARWYNTGHYPYKELLGGDGMQIAVDSRSNNTVYTGFQFGWYYRINKHTGKKVLIKPQHELGERPLRFNWQTPIHLSIHNQDILYLGANKLYRSMDQGNNWKAISEDLSTGGKKGDVPFGTISSLSESSFQFGKLFVGSDDGLIHFSPNGGVDWVQCNKGLPSDLWVTGIIQSQHKDGRVFCSLNGYRSDDFNSYVYMSEKEGSEWKRIALDLPAEPVNVVYEDPKNENIIYLGTDNGLYISLNMGQSFMYMNNQLPAVAIHDLEVHPRENELIVGTHGRSIYLADVSFLQELDQKKLEEELFTLDIGEKKLPRSLGKKTNIWSSKEKPQLSIPFYTNSKGVVEISISGLKQKNIFSTKIEAKKGINYFTYNYAISNKIAAKLNKSKPKEQLKEAANGQYYLPIGEYKIHFRKENNGASSKLKLVE